MGHTTNSRLVAAFRARREFPLYVHLKLHVYMRIAAARAQGTEPRPPAITSRRFVDLLRSLGSQALSMEFFDTSSFLLRSQLQSLNHGTALTKRSRGWKGVQKYEWNEPIEDSVLHSFLELRRVLGENLWLALDVYRLVEAFEAKPFNTADFIFVCRLYRENVRRAARFPLKGATSDSPQFTLFMSQRAQALLRLGLVERTPAGFVMTEKSRVAAHWFELFAFSLPYQR